MTRRARWLDSRAGPATLTPPHNRTASFQGAFYVMTTLISVRQCLAAAVAGLSVVTACALAPAPVAASTIIFRSDAEVVGGAAPQFVGVAMLNGRGPDVASVIGDQFADSGFGLIVDKLAPGTYDLALFPWSTGRATSRPLRWSG
jgi:hypothetical protein